MFVKEKKRWNLFAEGEESVPSFVRGGEEANGSFSCGGASKRSVLSSLKKRQESVLPKPEREKETEEEQYIYLLEGENAGAESTREWISPHLEKKEKNVQHLLKKKKDFRLYRRRGKKATRMTKKIPKKPFLRQERRTVFRKKEEEK